MSKVYGIRSPGACTLKDVSSRNAVTLAAPPAANWFLAAVLSLSLNGFWDLIIRYLGLG